MEKKYKTFCYDFKAMIEFEG